MAPTSARMAGIKVTWGLTFQTTDPLKQCDHLTVTCFNIKNCMSPTSTRMSATIPSINSGCCPIPH
jgi:hypothetical protein